MSKVLLIMPTYLHARFLAQDIEAVLNQTMQDFHMIVVNDHSPDDTAKILIDVKMSLERRERFDILTPHTELGTAGKAINYALNYAKAINLEWEYECRIDGDNLVYPNFLKELVGFLDTHPDIDMVYSEYVYNIMDKDDKITKKVLRAVNTNVDKAALLNGMCIGPSVMWRKTSRVKVGGYCEGWHEDWDFPLRILTSGGKLKYLDKKLMDYRYHVTNVQHRMANVQENFNEEVRNRFR